MNVERSRFKIRNTLGWVKLRKTLDHQRNVLEEIYLHLQYGTTKGTVLWSSTKIKLEHKYEFLAKWRNVRYISRMMHTIRGFISIFLKQVNISIFTTFQQNKELKLRTKSKWWGNWKISDPSCRNYISYTINWPKK